jgi:hypothetical protein
MSDHKAEQAKKALDRIVKLVKLAAHNPHEEEARSAGLLACKLMVEHNVTLRLKGDGLKLPQWAPPSHVPQPGNLQDSMRYRDEVRRSFVEWEKQYWDALIRGERV